MHKNSNRNGKAAREAYRLLVDVKALGKLNSRFSKFQLPTVTGARLKAREQLVAAGHYPYDSTELENWSVELTIEDPSEDEDGWVTEIIKAELKNARFGKVVYVFCAYYHRGYEHDNYTRKINANFDIVPQANLIRALKFAKEKAIAEVGHYFEEAGRDRYGRESVCDLYGDLNIYVQVVPGAYNVIFEDFYKCKEVLKMEFDEDLNFCDAYDDDGNYVAPLDDEIHVAHEQLYDYFDSLVQILRRRL